MGACDFQTMSFGRTPQEAFDAAVDDALHWHGHGGYTGTVAEKRCFKLFRLPKGIRADTAQKLVDLARRGYGLWEWTEWLRESDCPKEYRGLVKEMARAADDKWGPAVMVEVPAKIEREYREREGLKGMKGSAYWIFGWAPS